jgi:hypothetical protein
MSFDPKRIFNIEVAGIATIILSIVVLAYVVFSVG